MSACATPAPAAVPTKIIVPATNAATQATLAPTHTPAPFTTTPSQPISNGRQTYHNQVGFEIQYPATWQITNLPEQNDGQRHGVRIEGREGGMELQWGTGFGGACPEGYQKIRVAQGELDTCFAKSDNGTAMWTQINKQLAQVTFGARAWSNDPTPASHDLILQILSTLRFDQP